MGRCCRKSSPHGGCPSPSTIVPYVNFGLLWSKGIGRKKQLSACSLLIYTTWSIPFLQPLGKECSTGTLFLKSPWNHIQGCHPKNAEASNGNTETQRVARPKHPKRSSPAWYFAKIKNHQRSPADKWWQMFMFSSNAARHIPQFSHHSSSATTFCRVWTSNPTETTQLYSTKINLFHAISPSFYDILSPMHSRRRPWFPQNCNLSTYWNWSWIKFVFVRDSHDSNHIGLGLAPFLNKPTSPTYQIQSHKVRLKSLSLSPIWCCLVDGNVHHKLLSAIQSYLNFSMPPYAYDTATAMGIATTLSSI